MGAFERDCDAAASWLRGPGTGAFERPHRALSATGCTRQHAGLPTVDSRTVLSSVAAAGVAAVAQAAGCFHSEEHAAASRRKFFGAGLQSSSLPQRASRNGNRRSQASADLHRQNRARVADGAQEAEG